MEAFILIVLAFFVCIFIAAIIRPVVFMFEPLFQGLNLLLWFLQNPLRWAQKNRNSSLSRGIFLTVTLTGLSIVWFVVIYIVTIPLRVVLALYYDVILYISTSLADGLQEFVSPKAKGFRHISGFKYLFRYIWTLPFRFVSFLIHGGVYIFDSFLMLGVSVALPTLTMKHGTSFESAGTKIAQSGKWLVGNGNYAGTGIYFGLEKKVAEHYAKQSSRSGDNGVVLVRVTLSFCKTVSALSRSKRNVGLGETGEQLTETISTLYQTAEHYREDFGGWWEYCILRKGQRGSFTSSWRIRPVAILREGKIVRLYGGFGHYSMGTGLIAGAISWAGFLYLMITINF